MFFLLIENKGNDVHPGQITHGVVVAESIEEAVKKLDTLAIEIFKSSTSNSSFAVFYGPFILVETKEISQLPDISRHLDEVEKQKEIVLPHSCFLYQSTGRKFPDVLDEVSHGKMIPWGTKIEIGKSVRLMFGGNLYKFFSCRTEQGEEGFIRSDAVPSEI